MVKLWEASPQPRARYWGRQAGQGPRVSAMMVSLLLHLVLLYLTGGWMAGQPLRTPAQPFVVDLLVSSPVSEPVSETAPPERALPEPVSETTALPPAPAVEPGAGVPETPVLEIPPEPFEAAVVEPVAGESLAAHAAPPAPRVRPDVVAEVAQRLLEQLDAPIASERSLGELPARESPREAAATRVGSAAGITGELGERGLLYMEHPPYAEWGRRMGVEAEVRFRLWVSPEGHVVRIQAVRKSAYPEFESLARASLARWQFEPLPRGQEREEWGEVPFTYHLRRTGND